MSYNITTFFVVPRLPRPLKDLETIAYNLWWSWNIDAISLFRRLDAHLWQEAGHNPVKMLTLMEQARLESLANDEAFLAHMRRVADALRTHTTQRCWYQRAVDGSELRQVAYFCAEFGITEALPIYSGGLGVLAGDHLQAASELGFPMIGVGLMYREGYFHQTLSSDGWQQEQYPVNDLFNLPVKQVLGSDGAPVTVVVDCPHPVSVHAWLAQVGRIPLYLLTTDVEPNTAHDRTITGRLYGGDSEMRLRQEIILGVGGMRFLAAMGAEPTVCHLNEGHPVFSVLERIRQIRERAGVSFEVAREVARAGTLFTTHTPVPAGHDEFGLELIDRYFASMYPSLGVDRPTFLGLGQKTPGAASDRFSLSVLAIRLSAGANGVSRLHGEVARKMWHSLWPDAVVEEVPVRHVTNGIHSRSWISRDIAYLLDSYVGPRWHSNPEDLQVWKLVDSIPDEELWQVHERRRERLVNFVRGRVARQVEQRKGSARELHAVRDILDPKVLTIGFARRFATYKRAALIVRDLDRLERLLTDPHRPMQIIFAGKAHPQDGEGKKLIQMIFSLCRNEKIQRRVAFVQDYSIEVARHMVQGVDVWLNTPRRPMEASGTSGMKVAANGGLNCSILDGWWAEAYNGDNGWAIGNGDYSTDPNLQDELEARSLYSVLEDEVIPLFYQRHRNGVPHDWIRRMKASLKSIGPVFNTTRMVYDYAQQFYLPFHGRNRMLAADDFKLARELVAFQLRIDHCWDGVGIVGVQVDSGREVPVGDEIQVTADVELGDLVPDEVRVELLHGPVTAEGNLVDPDYVLMAPAGQPTAGEPIRYRGRAPCSRTGQNAVAVRVIPHHNLMVPAQTLRRIVWHRH
ncbi:MAG: alpha-glucan family phosphorylase [Candidatus Riflebacteria bacterium]|nr:alpha-glucan family phosphorylase [Candidatus Riflebacteria bacterium]